MVACVVLVLAGTAFGNVIVGWGSQRFGSSDLMQKDFIAITAGYDHSLALRADGSIVGWGSNWNGVATPPSGSDFVAIAAGAWHSLALRANGSIVGWGSNTDWRNDYYGQATPPLEMTLLPLPRALTIICVTDRWFDHCLGK